MIYDNVVENLRLNFVGEYVVVYLKNMNVATVTPAGDKLAIAGMVEGYVVDVDNEAFYIGQTADQFQKMIYHDTIGIVEFNDPNQVQYTILDDEDFDGSVQ